MGCLHLKSSIQRPATDAALEYKKLAGMGAKPAPSLFSKTSNPPDRLLERPMVIYRVLQPEP
jgi:hypothetical protein